MHINLSILSLELTGSFLVTVENKEKNQWFERKCPVWLHGYIQPSNLSSDLQFLLLGRCESLVLKKGRLTPMFYSKCLQYMSFYEIHFWYEIEDNQLGIFTFLSIFFFMNWEKIRQKMFIKDFRQLKIWSLNTQMNLSTWTGLMCLNPSIIVI